MHAAVGGVCAPGCGGAWSLGPGRAAPAAAPPCRHSPCPRPQSTAGRPRPQTPRTAAAVTPPPPRAPPSHGSGSAPARAPTQTAATAVVTGTGWYAPPAPPAGSAAAAAAALADARAHALGVSTRNMHGARTRQTHLGRDGVDDRPRRQRQQVQVRARERRLGVRVKHERRASVRLENHARPHVAHALAPRPHLAIVLVQRPARRRWPLQPQRQRVGRRGRVRRHGKNHDGRDRGSLTVTQSADAPLCMTDGRACGRHGQALPAASKPQVYRLEREQELRLEVEFGVKVAVTVGALFSQPPGWGAQPPRGTSWWTGRPRCLARRWPCSGRTP
jgi:hypothetical protein